MNGNSKVLHSSGFDKSALNINAAEEAERIVDWMWIPFGR